MNDKVNKRMCLGCREMFDKKDLVRVAKKDNEVFIDYSFKMGGRGAYICSNACLNMTVKGSKLTRALKTSVDEKVFLEIEEIFNGKQ